MAQKFENLIGGEWTPAPAYTANINPSDLSDVVGEYATADKAQAEAAIAAAKKAFPGWSNASPQVRSDVLHRAAVAIEAQADDLARLLSREEGKTLAEAKGEVMRASNIFRYFSGEAIRMSGEALASVRPGVEVEVRREAVGVVVLITPWNFPIAIPAWKIAPALAYGNTVVFKPAELTPGCAWALTKILVDAGLPPGVLNLVVGKGSQVGGAFTDSKDVDAISFTGSVPTGERIAAAAKAKKIQLEMGGKNAAVVLDDANLDQAVAATLDSAFFSTGQRCTASSRIIVTAGIHDAFVEKLDAARKKLKVGSALAPDTNVGPVASADQLKLVRGYIDIGRDEGAEVLGGALVEGPAQGYFLEPTLLVNSKSSMRTAQEEIFGPVASVLKVADLDEALHVVNDVEFGLSGGVYTTGLKSARRFIREAKVGLVMVNLPTAGIDYHVPFGGMKSSSAGPREQGGAAKEFYTTTKTAYILA